MDADLALFGLTSETLDPERLKAAWHRLALETHPDRRLDDESAVGRFRALAAARARLLKRLEVCPACRGDKTTVQRRGWTAVATRCRACGGSGRRRVR